MKKFTPNSPFLRLCTLLLVLLSLAGCEKELRFETRTFEKKTALPCKGVCPHIVMKLPVAVDGGIVSDSINQTMLLTLRRIIQFGEKPYEVSGYQQLADAFIASYDKTQKENPDDLFGWEGEVTGKVLHRSEQIIQIELQHYTFMGGAHGYGGKTSLIFDAKTGKSLGPDQLFKNIAGFRKIAEAKFREKFQLGPTDPINSKGFLFENERFALPETLFVTDKGVLLYYNPYEIAAYAEGPQQVFIPKSLAEPYLAVY